MTKVKQVRDLKGGNSQPPKPLTTINLGNVPILTVKLLDQIVQEIQGLRQDLKDKNV